LLHARHTHPSILRSFFDNFRTPCIAPVLALTQIRNMTFYNKHHTGRRLASLRLRDLIEVMGRHARCGVSSWFGVVVGGCIGGLGSGAGVTGDAA
jgi:hypothetical protein